MEKIIRRTSTELQSIKEGKVDIFIEKNPTSAVDVCGLLVFDRVEENITYYNVVANGCVWVYLTDCNENIEAGMQYQCYSGNSLNIEGCHAFGCQC